MFRSSQIRNTHKRILKEFPEMDSNFAYSLAESYIDHLAKFDLRATFKVLLQCLAFGAIYAVTLAIFERISPESAVIRNVVLFTLFGLFIFWMKKDETKLIRNFVQTRTSQN